MKVISKSIVWSYLFIAQDGMGGDLKLGGKNYWSENKLNKDVLDDRITLLIRKNGSIKIVEFYNASVDSTNYITNGRSADNYDGKKHYGTLTPQKMIMKPFIRKGKKIAIRNPNGWDVEKYELTYLAWRLQDPLTQDMKEDWQKEQLTSLGKNPAYPERGVPGYMTSVLLHASTSSSWNTSQGCQVIMSKDYVEHLYPYFGKYIQRKESKNNFWEFDMKQIGKGTFYLINQ